MNINDNHILTCIYIYINYVLYELLRSRQFPTVPTCGCTSSWSALKQPLCDWTDLSMKNGDGECSRQKLEWISVHHQEMAWLAGKCPSQVWWSFFSTIRGWEGWETQFVAPQFPSAPSPIALPRFQALRDVTNLGTLLGHGVAQNMF